MSVQIIAPVIAQMDGSGNVTVESIQPAHVAMTGITHIYAVDVPRNDALLQAFTVTDADPAAGQADFTVSLAESFKAALAGHMAVAQGGALAESAGLATGALAEAPAGSTDLETTLESELTDEIAGELNANGVLEFLEANALSTLNVGVDYSAAAADMFGKLTEDHLKMLYLQVGNRPINDNADASVGSVTFSEVLNVADTLAFVFNLSTEVKLTQVDVNVVSDISGAGYDASAASGAAPNLGLSAANYQSGARRVAFYMNIVAAAE